MPSSSAARVTGGRPSSPTPGWKGPTASATPTSPRNGEGMARLFRQFSFPGGIPSHCSPGVPGSIHEGGELGYSLSHAFGAAFDNPELVVACVVGDGEAETGPAATGWHSNKFLDPRRDGVVLPILHLNGYKIAAPTVLARIPESELLALFTGYGYHPVLVEGGFDGESPMARAPAHGARARRRLRRDRRDPGRPLGCRDDGTAGVADADPADAQGLDRARRWWTGCPSRGHSGPTRFPWPRSAPIPSTWPSSKRGSAATGPKSCSMETGCPVEAICDFPPIGAQRMSANPHANGGLLLADLELPDFCDYAVEVPSPGAAMREATRVLGSFLRDAMRANPSTFRLFGPDETSSNRLQNVFEVTDRTWDAETRARRRPPGARRPGDGGALRAPVPGMARGVPPHRPPWPLQLLRGVHPHRRLDVQPACEVVEGRARRFRGAAPSPR